MCWLITFCKELHLFDVTLSRQCVSSKCKYIKKAEHCRGGYGDVAFFGEVIGVNYDETRDLIYLQLLEKI